MKLHKLLGLTLLASLAFASLSACDQVWKEWDIKDVKKWNEKMPTSWDEFQSEGNIAVSSGNDARAATMFQQGLELAEAMYGPGDLRVATSATSLGYFYAHRGKAKDAAPLYKKALDIQKQQLGWDNHETIQTRKAYAAVLKELFKADEAKEILSGIEPDSGKKPTKKKKGK